MAPDAPVAPVAPCAPIGPDEPSAPRGPATTAPAAPVAPGAPCAPIGPAGPCGPAGPTSPGLCSVCTVAGCVVAQPATNSAKIANDSPRLIRLTSGLWCTPSTTREPRTGGGRAGETADHDRVLTLVDAGG